MIHGLQILEKKKKNELSSHSVLYDLCFAQLLKSV